MASRALTDLHPFVKAKAQAFIARANDRGIVVLITATRRTPQEQEAYYDQGRSLPGKIVTNAHAADTPHCFGLAFDCVPLKADGTADWNAPATTWHSLYQIAEIVGLDALGDPHGEFVSWDLGHFQEPGWRLLKDVA